MASTIPNGARRLARLAKQSHGSANSAVDGPKDAGGHPASNHVPFGGLCSGHQNRDGISGKAECRKRDFLLCSFDCVAGRRGEMERRTGKGPE